VQDRHRSRLAWIDRDRELCEALDGVLEDLQHQERATRRKEKPR
jgi:hypothetical protein